MTDSTNERSVEQELPELTEEELDLIHQFDYPIGQAFQIIKNIEQRLSKDPKALEKLKKFFMESCRATEKTLKDIKDKTGPDYARLKQALIGSIEEQINIIGVLSQSQRNRDLNNPQDLQEFKQRMSDRYLAILPFMQQVGANPLFKAMRKNILAEGSTRLKKMISDYLK